MTDIQIIAQALQERATLKPSPRKAKEALEAFERVATECVDELEEGLTFIHQAQQVVNSRMTNQ
jgi:hypothetical protein